MTYEYDCKLQAAVNEMWRILDDIEGDFDIHEILLDLSIRYDVKKSDLLETYDSQY